MTWQIDYSRESLKFVEKSEVNEKQIIEDFKKVIKRFKGENVNIDIKRLKGKWQGFYRLRTGKRRIIFEINFEEQAIYVERIDFRGSVY